MTDITKIGKPLPNQHEEFELKATVKLERDTMIIPGFWQECGEISGSEHLKTLGTSMMVPGIIFFFAKEKIGDEPAPAIYTLDVRAALKEALNTAERLQAERAGKEEPSGD